MSQESTKVAGPPFHCRPLWLVRWWDVARYLAKGLRPSNRYHLADSRGALSCHPLFIVSAGRSGTTLLRSMLVAGGQIGIPPEMHVLRIAVRRFLSLQCLGWSDLSQLILSLFENHHLFDLWDIDLRHARHAVDNLPEEERCLARIIDEVYAAYAYRHFPDASLWGDQSPINTLYLPWILATFPKGKYLHLLRDPRDAISSMIKTGRMDLESAMQRWRVSVQRAIQAQQRLDASQFLEIRYEALVSRPKDTLMEVCAFLGIQYTAKMLDFWKLPTTIEHKHFEFHRNLGKPLFTDSVGIWTQRLTSEEQELIFSRTKDLLYRFGYLK